MATTKQIPRTDWKSYFDRFSKEWLGDNLVHIEVASEELGDQVAVEDARLRGITWDHEVLDIFINDEQHLILHPRDIEVIEDDDGFVTAIDVAREDGAHEIVQVRRA